MKFDPGGCYQTFVQGGVIIDFLYWKIEVVLHSQCFNLDPINFRVDTILGKNFMKMYFVDI